MMARNFRTLLPRIVPSWLSEGDGGKVLFVLGAMLDVSLQRIRDSLEARMPGRAGASAQALIGADRGLPRGRAESNLAYAERLRRWRWPRGHRVRGGAPAWLEQLAAYWGGVVGYSVDVAGNRYDIAADGAVTATHGTSWQWDAGATLGRARFWTVLDMRDRCTAHPTDWDLAYGTTWDPDSDYTIGQLGAAPGDATAIRRLLHSDHPWKPAGSRGEWLVVLLSGSDVTPETTWANWSYVDGGGIRRESRSADARYWRLSDAANTYSGDPTSWTGAFMPGSGEYYVGEALEFIYAADWIASCEGPDGTTYTGDPTQWAVSALLPDDGDHL